MGCSGSKEQPNSPELFEPQQSQDQLHPEHLSKEKIEQLLHEQLELQLEIKLDNVSNELASPQREQRRLQQQDESQPETSLSKVVEGDTSDLDNTPFDALSLDNVNIHLSAEEEIEHKRTVRISRLRAELLSSEQTYVSNMTTAMEVIMLPIIEDSIIDADTAADQFNDFIAIAKFNKIMLEEFEASR
jgi:hypothetical protein